MHLLLDTHVFIWLETNSKLINQTARSLIADQKNQRYLSGASAWEIAIKWKTGRLKLEIPPAIFIDQTCDAAQIEILPIKPSDALGTASLPEIHSDPFDRLLVSQAIREKMTLLTADERIRQYPVESIW